MELMEEESVQAIRETSRNVLFLNRKRQKAKEIDVRRSLANLRITHSDVTTIANKLKTKSAISASDLELLQNALVDDPSNVEVVLNTHGALRGLVRELSGHDFSKQCAACGCLCNLALGDSKTCYTLAKAAGAYLVAALDTLTTQLAVSCAWTLGNLAGSGARVCHLLTAQGALAKLCDVMRGGGEKREAAVFALTNAAFALQDDFRPEYLHKIIESLSNMDLNIDSSQLLFVISCHKDFNLGILPEIYVQRIIEKLKVSMENHLNVCKGDYTYEHASISDNIDLKTPQSTKCCELVYLIRVLANLNSEIVYSLLVSYFLSNNMVRCIRRLSEEEEDKSLLWLLGNMLNSCGDNEFFNQLVSGV